MLHVGWRSSTLSTGVHAILCSATTYIDICRQTNPTLGAVWNDGVLMQGSQWDDIIDHWSMVDTFELLVDIALKWSTSLGIMNGESLMPSVELLFDGET